MIGLSQKPRKSSNNLISHIKNLKKDKKQSTKLMEGGNNKDAGRNKWNRAKKKKRSINPRAGSLKWQTRLINI